MKTIRFHTLTLLTLLAAGLPCLAAYAPAGREYLPADRTYYVLTTGADANNGLTNSAGGGFLTIQHAIDVVASLDVSIYNVTIQVADGTYAGANILKTFVGSGLVTITGNASTPTNVVITATSAADFSLTQVRGRWHLSNMRLKTISSGNCIEAYSSAVTFSGIDFNVAPGASSHVFLFYNAYVEATGNYTISGSAGNRHADCNTGSVFNSAGRTIVITNTPAFSQFAAAYGGAIVYMQGMTFTGSATGARYGSQANAFIWTNSAGTNYFPGSTAGFVATGGLYL